VTVAHYLGVIPKWVDGTAVGSPGRRPWRAVPGIDGGGALILVAAERARDFPQSLPLAANRGPVYLLGTGESVETPMVSQMADFTPRARSASPVPRPLPRPASRTTTSTT
jgi:hypothetical protein